MTRALIKQLVEIFSMLTGVAFLGSALIHVILFSLWGLDFMAVASVEDIITGGIRLLVTAMLAAPLSFLFAVALSTLAVDSRVSRRNAMWKFFMAARFVAVTAILLLFAVSAKIIVIRYGIWVTNFGNFKVMIAHLTLLSVIIAAFLAVTSLFPIKQLIFKLLADKTKIGFLTTLYILLVVVSSYLPYSFANMKIQPLSSLPAICREHHRVRWVGGRSVVVACKNRSYVIRNEAPLILEVKDPHL
jgi:hypothetical protein